MPDFTATEMALMNILCDGKPHDRVELARAIDQQGLFSIVNLQNQISRIRKKLRPQGQDILLQFIEMKRHYRLVRLISTDE